MNRYEVIIHDDRPGANPRKIRLDYVAANKDDARDRAEEIAEAILDGAPCAIEVEYRGKA